MKSQDVVSVDWLINEQLNSNPILLDASMVRAQEYIPGAQIFDFSRSICDQTSSLPNTMPSATFFTEKVRSLGICKDSTLVVYDTTGVYASPRAWWMFRAMGHTDVFVLDGGLPAWKAMGHRTFPSEIAPQRSGDFTALEQPGYVMSGQQVSECIGTADTYIIDVRSAERFAAISPESRAGLRSGHIPSSINIPYSTFLSDTKYQDLHQLKSVFKSAGIETSDKLVFSCGSGVTACIGILAAYQCGYRNLSLYDGSWTEWGMAHP